MPGFSGVAPCAGAWVEIGTAEEVRDNALVAPCAGAWVEMAKVKRKMMEDMVAPCAGAWVEMLRSPPLLVPPGSLPVRERGLKCKMKLTTSHPLHVAPCAGAWVEIDQISKGEIESPVAPCAGAWVEIWVLDKDCSLMLKSLPVRERGLKSPGACLVAQTRWSLPVRERGLK